MLRADTPHTDTFRVAVSGSTPIAEAIVRASARHGLQLALAPHKEVAAADADAIVIRADAVWFTAVEFAGRTVEATDSPVVVWAREPSAACRVAAYERGVADVLPHTIDAVEFAVRVRAAAKRATRRVSPAIVTLLAHSGPVTVTLARRQVHGAGGPILLTAMQWRLLHRLIVQRGVPQSHTALIRHVWGQVDDPPARHTLRTHISALRRRLQLEPHVIRTVHGYGYVLTD